MPRIKTSIEADVNIDIEVWCETCGTGLCSTVSVIDTSITVPACSKCMANNYEAGQEVGDREGYDRCLADNNL